MSAEDLYIYLGLVVMVGFAAAMLLAQKKARAEHQASYLAIGVCWLAVGCVWLARLYSKGLPHRPVIALGAAALLVGVYLCFRAARVSRAVG